MMIDFDGIFEELERSLSIDIYGLDTECSKHSELFLQAAKLSSQSNLEYNQIDLKLKETKAEVGTDVRNDPGKYGVAKITEGQVEEAVLQHEEIRAIGQERLTCLERKNLADALVTAFEHRRSMINNEVQLSLSGLAEPEKQARREMTEREIVRKKIIKKASHEKDS